VTKVRITAAVIVLPTPFEWRRLMKFDPFTLQFWCEIGVALLRGSIIGLERELRGNRPEC
jgi:hypothetical protein